MTKNELRVGNWVLRSVTCENYKPYEISHGYDIDSVEFYKPIELTTEILEKCGFEWETKNQTHLQIDVGGLVFCMYRPKGEAEFAEFQLYSVDNVIGSYASMPLPHYLHQMQNVIHSITGKELEMNL